MLIFTIRIVNLVSELTTYYDTFKSFINRYFCHIYELFGRELTSIKAVII